MNNAYLGHAQTGTGGLYGGNFNGLKERKAATVMRPWSTQSKSQLGHPPHSFSSPVVLT